jgi:hypothetical protein
MRSRTFPSDPEKILRTGADRASAHEPAGISPTALDPENGVIETHPAIRVPLREKSKRIPRSATGKAGWRLKKPTIRKKVFLRLAGNAEKPVGLFQHS